MKHLFSPLGKVISHSDLEIEQAEAAAAAKLTDKEEQQSHMVTSFTDGVVLKSDNLKHFQILLLF